MHQYASLAKKQRDTPFPKIWGHLVHLDEIFPTLMPPLLKFMVVPENRKFTAVRFLLYDSRTLRYLRQELKRINCLFVLEKFNKKKKKS